MDSLPLVMAVSAVAVSAPGTVPGIARSVGGGGEVRRRGRAEHRRVRALSPRGSYTPRPPLTPTLLSRRKAKDSVSALSALDVQIGAEEAKGA